MPASLSDLIAQREELERQIQSARAADKSGAIAEVRKLMAEYGLTPADLAAKAPSKAGAKTGVKVAAKYRDPSTGASWTGRGLKPKWLTAAIAAGRKQEDFAV